MEHVYEPTRDPLLQLASANAATFRPGFIGWLYDSRNRHVWVRFAEQADRLWDKGRKRYSARTIIEWMRHHTLASDASAEFKISNNIAPDLARLYLLMNPEREGFFAMHERGGVA